jgi:hypothetical protein
MRIGLYFFILLQASFIFKNVIKNTPKSSVKVVAGTIKSVKNTKKIFKASENLISDELFLITENKQSFKNEFKAEVSGTKFNELNKANLISTEKGNLGKLKKTIDELIDDKIEDAIEEILFETISRSDKEWDLAMFQLMLKKNWTPLQGYFKSTYNFQLKNKLDFFLLMNDMEVDKFRLSKRNLAKILFKTNIYKAKALNILVIDLSEYQFIIDRIQTYSQKNKITINKKGKLNDD